MNLNIILFLFLLIIITYYYYHIYSKEGFIAYRQSDADLNQVKITNYSDINMLYKVYDSIYYDKKNGNVLELFGENANLARKE